MLRTENIDGIMFINGSMKMKGYKYMFPISFKLDLSVADDNDRAIKLYERMGFKVTGREVHALKHADGDYSDWVMMVKFLK